MDKLNEQKITNSRIVNTTVVIGLITTLVYLFNAIKDLIAASYFGTTDAMDAYLLALMLPTFCINVFAGSIPSSLIPAITQVRQNDSTESSLRLLASINTYGGILLFSVTIILLLSSFILLPFLGTYFSPEKLELTKSIFYCLLPLILLQGLCIIWSASLNTFDQFALIALFPIFSPILTLMLLTWGPKSWTVFTLVWGAITGTIVQLSLLIHKAYSIKIIKLPNRHPAVIDVAQQYWPIVAGALLVAGNTVIDQTMAARLHSGSLAAINYGDRIIAAILGISSLAIGTAVLPYFSKLAANQKWDELNHIYKKYTHLIWIITVPLTITIIIFSEQIVGLFWERGAFISKDTLAVSQIQICYAIRIPFYLANIVMVRLIFSLKKNHFIFLISGSTLGMNFILNLLFIKIWGVPGLALSTSVVYAISCLMLYYTINLCWLQVDMKKNQ